jgi:predicted lipid-binding transport protein (Tim44 family)
MTNCQNCGARLAPTQPVCGICKQPFPHAVPSVDVATPSEPVDSIPQTPQTAKPSLAGAGRALYLAAWGGAGGLLGSLIGEIVGGTWNTTQSWYAQIGLVGLWFAVISSTIAFAVAIGQTRYLGHKRIGFSHVSTAGLGALAGFFAGAIAQFAFDFGQNEVVRDLCWGLAGALAGTALSWRIPNLRWHRGFAGGLLGGLIGGGFFILLSWAFSDVVGRAVGLTSIGFMIGAMIVAAETAFREAWIEVHYGPKELRTVSLGKEPIRIGSDASRCAVYVRGAAPVDCSFVLQNRRIACEDANGRLSYPAAGSSLRIGNAEVVVRGG